MKNQQHIPTHSLKQRTHESLHVNEFHGFKNQETHLSQPHRDDHYVLLFQQKGNSRFMVDFSEIIIDGCAVIIIFPGQIHYRLSADESVAWSIGIDASWFDDRFSNIFQRGITQNESVCVLAAESAILENTILLLQEALVNLKQTKFYEFTLKSFADTLVTLYASLFSRSKLVIAEAENRASTITREFKQLLHSNFTEMKSPSQYAAALNISVSYLNEVVKTNTGYSTGYWIQEEITWEAKRILFYTDYSVKEISAILGYEDSAYFIRTFSRVTKLSPLQFRKKYRK